MNEEMKSMEMPEVENMNEATDVIDASEVKAAAILRARLPHLSAEALNFEKRTGNFFRGVAETAEDGTQKISRRVVEDKDIPEVCADEMQAKRAAAYILGFEAESNKQTAKIGELKKAIDEAQAAYEAMRRDYDEAVSIVNAFELSSKPKQQTRAAIIEQQQNEIDRLRKILHDAGIEA